MSIETDRDGISKQNKAQNKDILPFIRPIQRNTTTMCMTVEKLLATYLRSGLKSDNKSAR
jgi:hypothetical protein